MSKWPNWGSLKAGLGDRRDFDYELHISILDIIFQSARMEIKVVENENEVYIKDKLLGEGAFGKAYLVKHKQTNELLVIKEMSIQHMSSKEKEETVKEAQILKNLNHPNIVNFREVYMTKNSKLKIVMEYA